VHERDGLAERFEAQRPQLRAVAYRMLGSPGEADDAVQEAWLRLSGVVAGEVDNLAGWLRTVVTRICLDMLRSARHVGRTRPGSRCPTRSRSWLGGPNRRRRRCWPTR
jgi:RNA polymerase sigma-70 factor (ECF subfamily)